MPLNPKTGRKEWNRELFDRWDHAAKLAVRDYVKNKYEMNAYFMVEPGDLYCDTKTGKPLILEVEAKLPWLSELSVMEIGARKWYSYDENREIQAKSIPWPITYGTVDLPRNKADKYLAKGRKDDVLFYVLCNRLRCAFCFNISSCVPGRLKWKYCYTTPDQKEQFYAVPLDQGQVRWLDDIDGDKHAPFELEDALGRPITKFYGQRSTEVGDRKRDQADLFNDEVSKEENESW